MDNKSREISLFQKGVLFVLITPNRRVAHRGATLAMGPMFWKLG